MSKFLNELKQLESGHLQEELAKTYFSASPKEIPFTRSLPISKGKKRRHIFLAVIIGSLAAAIAVFFTFNRVMIDVKIVPSNKVVAANNEKLPDALYLNQEGDLNTDVIRNIVFYENSNSNSKWGKEFVTLSNEDASKKAVLGIDFTKPLNLNDNVFCFYSKGKNGAEEFRISLRDNKNNSCYSKINEVRDSWQQFMVNLEEAKGFIDSQNIIHMDFEVNPAEKTSLSQSMVYFKDIYLAKRRGQ